MCIVCALNYTQTIHKTLHWSVQNPTQRAFAKLYTKRNTNPTFCFRTRMERMEFRTRKVRKEWMVRKKRKVRIVRNVCNERYVRYERKIGNGNRRWRASSLPPSLPLFDSLSLPISFPPPRHSFPPPRHSCAPPPKIQQFWVIFQRFDINIFNLPEHFPPPNFAFSAHNFSLPSPNLN